MFRATSHEEALARLEWDLSWHYALDLLPEEAHTCQKTLHNFRKLLLDDDEGAGLFESTTAKLIENAELSTRRQRQDSTHILSNIKILTRLGLFTGTITGFLKALRDEHPRLCADVSEQLLGRYLDREGYFADARSTEAPRRLSESALDLHWLVKRFGEHQDARLRARGGRSRLADRSGPPHAGDLSHSRRDVDFDRDVQGRREGARGALRGDRARPRKLVG